MVNYQDQISTTVSTRSLKPININRRLKLFTVQEPQGDELQAYLDKLRADGEVLLHVWEHKNVLLDKFMEYRLCQKHNIPYRIVPVSLSSQEEAERWIINNELCHSHLSNWQRAQLVIQHFQFYYERLAHNNLKLSQGKGRKGIKKNANLFEKVDVNDRLAQKARVSKDTIARVKYIRSNKSYAPTGLIQKLDAEELSINAAYHLVMRSKKHINKDKRTSARSPYINDMSKGIENNVICSDALEGIEKITDGSLTLVMTSPPFCVGKEYADNVSDDKPWKEHIEYLTRVFGDLKAKLRAGGRCVIEYQPIRTREKEDQSSEYNRPIHSVITNMMLDLRYQYMTTIIWDKGDVGRQPQAWGGICSPSKPVIRTTHSNLFVFSVGGTTLPCISGDSSELSQEDYDELTQSVWHVHTESRAIGSHCCPMPVELAERVIRLYSYKGDLVADPFGGSGTTAIAALRLGRRFYLVDKSPTYCSDSQKRIQDELKKLNPGNDNSHRRESA